MADANYKMELDPIVSFIRYVNNVIRHINSRLK